MGSPLGTVASGAKWSALSAWGERLMSTVVFVVLARLLEPSDFGVVAVAAALVFLLNILQDGGLPQAIVQRDDLRPEHVSSALVTNIGLSLVLTAGLLPLAGPIAGLFDEPAAAAILRVLAANLVIGSLAAVPNALLHRTLRFRTLALRTLFAKAVGGSVAVAVALAGGGAWALVAQSVVQATLSAIVLWAAIPDRPGLRFHWWALRDLLGYGGFALGSRLVVTATERVDTLVIGGVLGSSALGLYTIAYRVLDILTQLFGKTIQTVMMPVLSRLQQERTRHRGAVLELLTVTVAVAAPAFVGWALVADPALTVVFGEKWAAAVPVAQALAFVGLLRVLVANIHMAIASLGHARPVFGLHAFRAATTVACFALTVRFGLVTFAVAYAVVVWVSVPIDMLVLRRFTGIGLRTFLGRLRTPALALTAMVIALVLLRRLLDAAPPLVLVVGLVLAGALVYGLAVRLLDERLARTAVDVMRRGRRVAGDRQESLTDGPTLDE